MRAKKVPSPGWLLFFLPLLLSASLSPDPWLSIVGRYNAYAWGLLGLSLCAIVFYSELGLLFPVAVVLAGHAVLTVNGSGVNRAMGLIGSPVDLGTILAACILSEIPGKSRWRWAGGLLMLYALYLTGTRGAWLGLFIGIAYMIGKVYAKKNVYTFLTISVAAGGVLLLFHHRPVSDAARVEVWKAAIETIKEAPLLGHGPDSFEDAFKRHRSQKFMDIMGNKNGTNRSQADAHNSVLSILCFFGFVGLATFGVFFYFVGVSPPLIAIFVASMFNPISLEVIALAALFAGRLVPRERSYPWLGRIFLAISLIAIYNIVLLCRADYWFQRGNIAKAMGVEEYPFYLEATKYNPTEPVYTASLINSIRGRNHELAISAAERLMEYRHSSDSQSFYAYTLRGAGDIRAKANMKAALALDPLNPQMREVVKEFK